MKKIKEYFRLRSFGFSRFDALTKNHVALGFLEKMAIFSSCIALTALIIMSINANIMSEINKISLKNRHLHSVIQKLKNDKELVRMSEYSALTKLQKLEKVIVNCLNGDGVHVNRRYMECQIKESREYKG